MISGTPISVLDYGATGDGSTNDTAAVQAAFDAGVATGKNFQLHFPPGTYKVTQILLGDAVASKGTIRIAITGAPQATTILSVVSSGSVFKVPKYWGYGAGSDWVFKDLQFKANTSAVGIGIEFEALNWNTRIQNCDFDGFVHNLYISSSITLEIENCRVSNASNTGILLRNATTGVSGLDEPTANARIANCYVNNCQYGVKAASNQAVVRDNVFENNSTYALSSMGDYSVVDGNWFEGIYDTIDGEFVDVAFTNNIGIASSPSTPLFTNSGNTFSLTTNNRCLRLSTGEYNNRYSNIIVTSQANNIQAIMQFKGVDKSYSSPTTTFNEVIQDASGNYWDSYSAGGAALVMISVVISETYSGNVYVYEPIIGGFASPYTGTVARYIVFGSGYMSVYGSDPTRVVASTTSTRFYIYRDGATGRLGLGWENKNASTTAITWKIRPLSNISSQF